MHPVRETTHSGLLTGSCEPVSTAAVEAPLMRNLQIPYRLELLPSVPAFHRKARSHKEFTEGQLVYYGPSPVYYGIGEVKSLLEGFVAVDFRGTGQFGVHEDMFKPEYLIPIPRSTLGIL
jgi:hypothetical protein